MTGGADVDTFVYSRGNDTVTDFDGDMLRLNDVLWGEAALSVSQVLDFAEVQNGDTVFDFGNGHTLTLENYTDIAGLSDQINIF